MIFTSYLHVKFSIVEYLNPYYIFLGARARVCCQFSCVGNYFYLYSLLDANHHDGGDGIYILLFGWLVIGLVGMLVIRLFGCLVGCLFGWLVGWLVGCLFVFLSVGRSVGWLVIELVGLVG